MKKDYNKQKIIQLLDKIENTEILEYLYIFIRGKVERYINDEQN